MLTELAAERRLLFIGGKGGVGKTTVASAVALQRARAGARVLVASTDPAHNLGHLWDRVIGDQVVPLWEAQPHGTGRLDGVEIDPAATTEAHLAEVARTLRSLMPDHLHRTIDQHLRLAAHSPGTHESALLERIATVVRSGLDAYDLIVFDTAPSGHTTRLLALPEIMSAWTEGLLDRRTTAERFGAAVRALDGRDDPGRDRDRRIRQALTRRRDLFEHLRTVVRDRERCSFVIVLTPEHLPVMESIALHHQLVESGVDVACLLANRLSPVEAGTFFADRSAREQEHLARLHSHLPSLPLITVPFQPTEILGAERLSEFSRSWETASA